MMQLLTAFFIVAMLVVAYFDFRHRIIPNRILVAIGIIGALAIGHTAITWQMASITAVAALVVGYAVWHIAPNALGAADAKLAAILGIWLGAWGLWAALILGLFGMVVMVGMVVLMKGKPRQLPVGGLMAIGALSVWVTVF